MPATVVVRLTPATERFTCMYSGGWMVLSDALRILRLEVSQPEGLILLNAKLPVNFSPAIGQQVIPKPITRCWPTPNRQPSRTAPTPHRNPLSPR